MSYFKIVVRHLTSFVVVELDPDLKTSNIDSVKAELEPIGVKYSNDAACWE